MDTSEIVIVAAKRTPLGSFLGSLAPFTAPQLAAAAHKAALTQAGLPASAIDEAIEGCVLQAGIGQAPARQAALLAGLPYSVPATTVNKMCGSGMQAVMIAADRIQAGSANIILAGGMESMSNAPYLLKKVRSGYRMGHGEIKDHLFLDGLEDAYELGKLMGCFADDTAEQLHISREQQDEYAARSQRRALEAQKNAAFEGEIVPMTIAGPKEEKIVTQDEGPDAAKLDKITRLKPAFGPNGTVTAANSSSISDGAASLILMSADEASRRGLTPLARIVAQAAYADKPAHFTTAPIHAIRKVLKKAKWQIADVDLFEINEAFAVVTLAAILELGLEVERVNVHGGACALGHPIGASGARIIVSLIEALKRLGKHKGVAALCIGGGEATALAIELI